MAKKTYLLDTSVYLTNADSIYSYANNDIIIPLKVLEEIDKHKKRQDGVKGELTLSDLINHFGYYGIDFQGQPDGLAILMDGMKKACYQKT